MLRAKIGTALAAAVLGISTGCFADTWTGASAAPFPANNNWSNLFNWASTSPPTSSPATDIIFGNSPRKTPNQDLGNDFLIHNLVFDAPGYQLVGASIAPAFIFSG